MHTASADSQCMTRLAQLHEDVESRTIGVALLPVVANH